MVDVMLISDIPEEPNRALGQKHRHAQCVYRCIAISFIVETASLIEPVEIGFIGFFAPEVQGSNFEIGEELAVVVLATGLGIEKPCEISFGVNKVRMGSCKGSCSGPEGWEGARVVEDVHVKAVFEVVVPHETKDVVVNVAEIMNLNAT